MEKSCCFTGHRDIPEPQYEQIFKAVYSAAKQLVAQGFTEFRCGGAVGFDMLAADAVLRLKNLYPEIRLVLYVSCLGQNKYYTDSQKKKYLTQINAADKIICISKK